MPDPKPEYRSQLCDISLMLFDVAVLKFWDQTFFFLMRTAVPGFPTKFHGEMDTFQEVSAQSSVFAEHPRISYISAAEISNRSSEDHCLDSLLGALGGFSEWALGRFSEWRASTREFFYFLVSSNSEVLPNFTVIKTKLWKVCNFRCLLQGRKCRWIVRSPATFGGHSAVVSSNFFQGRRLQQQIWGWKCVLEYSRSSYWKISRKLGYSRVDNEVL